MYYCNSQILKELDIEDKGDYTTGIHSYRRNVITTIINNTNGDVVLASTICGNSPQTALSHYYTGPDYEKARKALSRKK